MLTQSKVENRLSKKLESFVWFILKILPILLYLIINFRNPSATDFFIYLGNFAPVNAVVSWFEDILNMAITVDFPLINYLAYLFILEFLHVVYLVAVLPFKLCIKFMSCFNVGG